MGSAVHGFSFAVVGYHDGTGSPRLYKPKICRFKPFWCVGVFVYHKPIKTAYRRFLGHCVGFSVLSLGAIVGCPSWAQPGGDPQNQRQPPQGLRGLQSRKSRKSRKSRPESRVAEKSKVAFKSRPRVEKSKVAKVESRLRVGRVGRVDSRQSRRVAQVTRPDVLCVIVGVVMHVRCDHIFGLILIAKVVLTEENA